MRKMSQDFLQTEFGSTLCETITALDFWLCEKGTTSQCSEPDKYNQLQTDIDKLFAQWEVYKLALKQFYGIDYHFNRTDAYYGICDNDEVYLFKVLRD